MIRICGTIVGIERGDGFPKGNQHAGNCLDVKDKGVGGQTDPWVSASADQVDGCAIW